MPFWGENPPSWINPGLPTLMHSLKMTNLQYDTCSKCIYLLYGTIRIIAIHECEFCLYWWIESINRGTPVSHLATFMTNDIDCIHNLSSALFYCLWGSDYEMTSWINIMNLHILWIKNCGVHACKISLDLKLRNLLVLWVWVVDITQCHSARMSDFCIYPDLRRRSVVLRLGWTL